MATIRIRRKKRGVRPAKAGAAASLAAEFSARPERLPREEGASARSSTASGPAGEPSADFEESPSEAILAGLEEIYPQPRGRLLAGLEELADRAGDAAPLASLFSDLSGGEDLLAAVEAREQPALRGDGSPQALDLEALGGVLRESAGGAVYLDGRAVGRMVSDLLADEYRGLERSGWRP